MATALYRRYRPESFAEVIGQDHVTTPLRRALRAGRIGHAYLFSGPRGCGKTTSARILARCLNCAEGPTDVPCGQCDSCRDLANGGSGSLDVVEIDAASHGGVDDARELRERASFAPVRDRYKVFIIDEAHMVTSAGFNALLKLVEEPPEHVKFVFATTEPDKVIGTIRSRTHHYPFRLIPPQVLGPYLEEVCAAEQVQVGEGVMPLVVRAGGGSARDSMSVLDQLMAGAGDDGLDFPTAIALLGFTDTALLDQAITAVAERDAASLYSAVEHVLATGHEPRRFVEDLLERMRDLIVLAAVPDRGADLLPQVPADELESMRGQAALFAPADLSQCGDLVHETLSTMSGATSPRLHLELLAARLVLRDERAALAAADGPAPSVDARSGAPAPRGAQVAGAPAQSAPAGASDARGEARRIAQEKAEAARQARGGRGTAPAPGADAATAAPAAPAQQDQAPPQQAPMQQAPPQQVRPQQARPQQASAPVPEGPSAPAERPAATSAPVPWGDAVQQSGTAHPAAQESAPEQSAPQQSAPQQVPAAAAGGGGLDADQVRTHWSAILDELQQIRRPAWALVSQNGHVHGAHGSTLVIGFRTDGLINAFHRGTAPQNLADAVRRIMHVDVAIEAVVGEDPGPGSGPAGGGPGPGPGPGGGPASGPAGGGPAGRVPAEAPGQRQGGQDAPARAEAAPAAAPEAPARWGDAVVAEPPTQGPADQAAPEPEPVSAGQRASERAMRAAARAAETSRPAGAQDRGQDFPPEPDDFYPPEPDDPFPPDPQDEYQPRPRNEQSAPGPSPVSGAGRWSDAPRGGEQSSARPPASPAAAGRPAESPASAAPAAATSGEAPVVDDEGRDSLPPEEPRTFGQAALRRALAEGRAVRSRPSQNPAGGLAASAAVQADHSGDTSGDQGGQGAQSARPALQAVPSVPSMTPDSPVSPASADAAPRSIAASADAAGAPADVDGSAAARAAASWGTSATASAPSAPAAAAPSAAPAAEDAPAAPRSGAALVREAALASRNAGQRSAAKRGVEEPRADADPTGGATRDDEDAVVATRNGREVVEKILGGKVLEVIDENRHS